MAASPGPRPPETVPENFVGGGQTYCIYHYLGSTMLPFRRGEDAMARTGDRGTGTRVRAARRRSVPEKRSSIPTFTVVADRADQGSRIERVLDAHGSVRRFGDFAKLEAARTGGDAIVIAMHDDSTAFELLHRFREVHGSAPALVLCRTIDDGAAVRALVLGASAARRSDVHRSSTGPDLTHFAERAAAARRGVVELLDLLCRAIHLTAREADLVEARLSGVWRDQLARRMNIEESTVKSTIRTIVRKLDASGISAIDWIARAHLLGVLVPN